MRLTFAQRKTARTTNVEAEQLEPWKAEQRGVTSER
jgi:hypothetical protein